MTKRLYGLAITLLAMTPALAQVAAAQPAATPAAPSQPAATPPAAAAQAPETRSHAATQDKFHATLEQRINAIHSRLAITPKQEGAWSNFTQTMRDNAETVQQEFQKRLQSMDTMNASQNLQNFAQIEQDRAQGAQKLSVSFDTLYGQLSDEQKKTADQMFRHYELTARQARAGHSPQTK